MTDFEKLAITTLAGCGTDHGNALAMEIQRGMDRRAQTEQPPRDGFAEMLAQKDRRAQTLYHLRPATAADYHAWLLVHLAQGGHITHHRNYPFSPHDWYVATEAFTMHALYGAFSIEVIVPDGIVVTVADLGHNNIYYRSADGRAKPSGHYVPGYLDSPGHPLT